MKKLLIGVTAAFVAVSGIAVAQDAPFGMQIKARQGIMDYRAINLGVLGKMAKGEMDYDAAAAQKAADNLLTAVTIDTSMLWPPGSDNSANPASTALAAMWAEGSGVGDKAKAMVDAATAMQAAAGVDLASLQGAMEGVGGACGGCHKAFRVQN
jgi:cytochrome c556